MEIGPQNEPLLNTSEIAMSGLPSQPPQTKQDFYNQPMWRLGSQLLFTSCPSASSILRPAQKNSQPRDATHLPE